MESVFYPVVTIEDQEELDVVRVYCDENSIEFQFLDNDLNSFPAQVILFIDRDDFKLFLGAMKE